MEYLFGIDLVTLIKALGYVGLFLIIFAESGLFIGFFLPGDSLLFTAGFLASQEYLAILPLIIVTFSGAVLGDSFGYIFGRNVGFRIFYREDSLIFHKGHLERARMFYGQYGGKTIILARFIPIIRTFAPILAGVGNMKYSQFLLYNVIGGVLWGVGLPLLGYFLGSTVPNIDRYLIPIVILIIFASLMPFLIHILKNPAHRSQIKEFLLTLLRGVKGS